MKDAENSRRWQLVSKWWYGAIACVIACCLIIQLVLIFTGGEDANSGETGAGSSIPVRLWQFISYFTVDSNIVVMIVCLMLVAAPLRRGPWWEALRLNALLAITITGLVFTIVLAPLLDLSGWAFAASFGFHFIAPWAMLLGWLVFGPRRRFQWATIAKAFILPVIWLLYIFIQGAFTNWYPYPFLNVVNIGLGQAIVNALLVLLLAAVLALVFKLIDAKAPCLLKEGDDGASQNTNASLEDGPG